MADALPMRLQDRVTLIGIENDSESFASLKTQTSSFGACHADLIQGDFLRQFEESDLFNVGQELDHVDVIIANPPYVRTQVLGAKRSQELAARFNLGGRIDLYQAFLAAMARKLRPGGLLGVITSNRFLTTKAGTATRRFLRTAFDLLEIIDLGDSKLFEAAVLPALVFGRKRDQSKTSTVRGQADFIRVYETQDGNVAERAHASSLIEALRKPHAGLVRANNVCYRVTVGQLPIPNDDARPWAMLSAPESEWISTIHASTSCRIGDVARVRVGIKTTADGVFIRRDWPLLPADIRPEKKHVRPLLSHENAARWRSVSVPSQKHVLYTHEVVNGRRRAIPFAKSSSTWKYLTANRAALESRKYVSDAGRAWYEIWVPQDPSSWSLPKIVFPDISAEPKFFLDLEGRIIDGNCYWITLNDSTDNDLLFLILGVANSAVIKRYHELAFPNKLYAKRKRHLTQYVKEYPLPNRNTSASQQIIDVVRRLTHETLNEEERIRLESEVDHLTAAAFGVGAP